MVKGVSKLIIPNDTRYVDGVVSYSERLSVKLGFSEAESAEIAVALAEACENVITHAFDTYDDETFTITFEVLSDGIRIIIDEMGLPFSAARARQAKDTPGLHVIEENMDTAVFINRGKNGKELQMTKHLKGAHVTESFGPEDLKPYETCELPPSGKEFTVRLMRPEEALEVSRAIYRSYRYTYLKEDLYFPDRIAAMNRDGAMISAVAVTPRGEVAGHFALMPRPNMRSAEIGAAVVEPKYRKRGLMKRQLEFLIEEAARRGFVNLFGNAFTMHELSQRTNLKFGFHETGLQLAVIPPGSVKVQKDCGLTGPGHVINFFKYLRKSDQQRVFLPPAHEDILKEIYSRLGVERSFEPGEVSATLAEEAVINLTVKPHHKTAFIDIESFGKDLDRRVKAKLVELGNKGTNAVYVNLELGDPFTPEATERLQALGFFFSGLLPDFSGGDVLRLQYYSYYNTDVDYDEIHAYSPFARELVAYVRGFDPRSRAVR